MNVPWIKRSDLIIQPHDAGGWVVKDPLTLQFSLLTQSELGILNLMNGQLNFGQLLKEARRLSGTALSAEELADFIGSLASGHLIRQTLVGDADRMRPGRRGILQVISPLFRILRFQIRLINPTRLLDRLLPLIAWMVAQGALRVVGAVLAIGLLTAVVQFDALVTAVSSSEFLFGPQNIGLMFCVFIVVKVLHEAGHAVSARLFGAECTECGIMMMVFTPVLYTNVSDTWRLPARQRILVTAAGIIVELVLASVCLVLWTMAEPGLTKNLLLNTVLICSVNTVLFNGNPLLRFDGYFILADWVKIPNLASQAGNRVRDSVLSVLTGRSRNVTSHERSGLLLTYGVAAAGYRLFLTLAILQLVLGVAEEWRVEILGAILAIIVVTGFLVIPVAAFVLELAQEHAHSPFRFTSWLRLGIAGVGMAAIVLIPLPQTVVLSAFVIPEGTPVYAAYEGTIDEMLPYGESLEEGTEITRLSNHELLFRRSELQARADILAVDLANLRNLQDPETLDQIPGLEQALQAAKDRVEKFDTETSALTVVSPRAGILLPPPVRSPIQRTDLPELWYGLPGEPINSGAWIERGTLLGSVGDPTHVRLQIAVSERSIQLLKPQQTLTFFREGSASVIPGTLDSVSPLESETLAPQFAVTGAVAGQATVDSLRPAETTYIATAELTGDDVATGLYSVGFVRVQLEHSSLLSRFVRYLRQTF